MQNKNKINNAKKGKKLRENVEYILNEEGLTYASLPVKSRKLIEIDNIFSILTPYSTFATYSFSLLTYQCILVLVHS